MEAIPAGPVFMGFPDPGDCTRVRIVTASEIVAAGRNEVGPRADGILGRTGLF